MHLPWPRWLGSSGRRKWPGVSLRRSPGLRTAGLSTPAPNACWQLDATEYVLIGGRKCVIFQLKDDHSRLAIATHVASAETSEAAFALVKNGIEAHGVPQRLLTDNGAASKGSWPLT